MALRKTQVWADLDLYHPENPRVYAPHGQLQTTQEHHHRAPAQLILHQGQRLVVRGHSQPIQLTGIGKSMYGFFNGNTWDSRSFFHWLNPCKLLQPNIMGTYLSGTGSLGWGARCGAGVPCSQNVPPQFLPTTRVCGTSPFCFSVPPTIVNGCGFFNSIVVSLPFNSILDSSEWRLFYSVAAILMWLCKEVSHVYLCCHLDWMSYRPFIG